MTKCALLLCAMLTCGCEHKTYQLAEVAGRVTHGGQPMAGISISFQPMATEKSTLSPGPGSAAMTDSAGHYRLDTAEQTRQSGAIVGQHRVFLRAVAQNNSSDDGGYLRDPRIPPRYYDGSTVIRVPPEGLTSADFELAPP